MTSRELEPERARTTRTLTYGLLAAGGLLLVIGLVLSLPSFAAEFAPQHDTSAGAVVEAATASPTPGAAPAASPAVGSVVSPTLGISATTGITPAMGITVTSTPSPIPQPADPPTRIVAPAIHLDAQVTPMGWEGTKGFSQWVVPEYTAGWVKTSAPPGAIGNTVIAGHHNIYGKVFRYVVNLNPGDLITVYAGTKAYTYVVTQKYILKEAGEPASVQAKNAQWIAPTNDDRLTLVTCWPYYWPGNTHRVIVVAMPVPNP